MESSENESGRESFTLDELKGMKRRDLQALCKKHGYRANGKVIIFTKFL
jgi:hypothetical protein